MLKNLLLTASVVFLLGCGAPAPKGSLEEDAATYNNRGLAREAKGDHDGAIADYDHAIQLDPKYAAPYYNRGVAHESKGDLDGAISDYDHAVQLDPKYAAAYYNRGIAHESKSDLTEALADFTEGARLAPDDPDYGARIDAIRQKLNKR